jgi:hypothetical protein
MMVHERGHPEIRNGPPEAIVTFDRVTKRFRKVKAVDGLSLATKRGETATSGGHIHNRRPTSALIHRAVDRRPKHLIPKTQRLPDGRQRRPQRLAAELVRRGEPSEQRP